MKITIWNNAKRKFMNASTAIRERRSIRKYKQDDISIDTVLNVIEMGTLSPSAKNRQPWHFSVLRASDKDSIANLMLQYDDGLPENKKCWSSISASAKVIISAPKLVLIFKDDDSDYTISDYLSIGACVENMLLYATEIGLGCLWIRDTYCIENEASKLFGNGRELVCAVAMGIPSERPDARPRKKLFDVVDLY